MAEEHDSVHCFSSASLRSLILLFYKLFRSFDQLTISWPGKPKKGKRSHQDHCRSLNSLIPTCIGSDPKREDTSPTNSR
jgi:hypothetical protein